MSSSPHHRPAVRTLIALGAALAVLAVTGGAAGRAAPLRVVTPVAVPVVTLSDPASPADQLSVAVTGDYYAGQPAMALASWRTFDGRHWRIAVATDLGSGVWTSPRLVSPPGVDAEHPSAGIALSDDARSYPAYGVYQQVAWRVDTGEIQVVHQADPAVSWSVPVTVSEPGAETSAPLSAVSYDDSDSLFTYSAVAWLARDATYWRAHYLAFEPGRRPVPARVRLLSPAGHDAADLSLSSEDGVDDLTWVLHRAGHWQPQWWNSYDPARYALVSAPPVRARTPAPRRSATTCSSGPGRATGTRTSGPPCAWTPVRSRDRSRSRLPGWM